MSLNTESFWLLFKKEDFSRIIKTYVKSDPHCVQSYMNHDLNKPESACECFHTNVDFLVKWRLRKSF